MKYLAFIESNYEDLERSVELLKQIFDERGIGLDKFPKAEQILFNAHILEAELFKKSKDIHGFFVLETEKEEHLINYRMHLAPYTDIKFIPLTSLRKSLETWMGLNR